jgi:DNA primase
VLREADQFYRERLREQPDAIRYLKNRGIEGSTAGQFALGFAPDSWNALLERHGSDPQAVERLIRAGLAVRNEQGRVYDRFRNRIMFPIRDGRGRVIGFGGRLIESGEPKYLNSPDTPLFDKGRTLYGLYEARQRPGRPELIVVVEGYIDVIALEQYGQGPALATMGTAATAENMRHLTRLSDRIVFCFDGDRAGREAAVRAVQAVLPFGGGKVAIEFVLLPDGEDPDSFVRRRGAAPFAALLDEAVPLSTFLIAQAASGLDLGNADGLTRLAGRVLPMLEKLPNGHYRELIVAELADKTGLSPERLSAGANPGVPRAPASRPAAASPPIADPGRSVMQKAVSLLLHYPQAGTAAADVQGLDAIDAPGADLLRKLLEITIRAPGITTGELIETFRSEPDGRWVERLAQDELLDDEAAAPDVFRDSLKRLIDRHRRKTEVEALRRRRSPGATP